MVPPRTSSDGSFITSMLELKLDEHTMFEWQRHSQESIDVPHYQQLLSFIDSRAQAAVSDTPKRARKGDTSGRKTFTPSKPVASFTASAETDASKCVICKEKHPLYVCSKFN